MTSQFPERGIKILKMRDKKVRIENTKEKDDERWFGRLSKCASDEGTERGRAQMGAM